MWTTMGLVVIGGLTVSTFVTLIIVPVLYGGMERLRERLFGNRNKNKFVFMDINLNEK
jgi:HAE1 family hydrophobic/amphiphilic exporter-1